MIRRILARIKTERLPSVASALAFTTLLALVPLLTVMFAILSMFPFFLAVSYTHLTLPTKA